MRYYRLEVIEVRESTFTFRLEGGDSSIWLEDELSSLPQDALEALLNRWHVELYAACDEESSPDDPYVIEYLVGDADGLIEA